MYFRHTALLWDFTDLPEGVHASPAFRHVNPGFDDRDQEFVCFFELTNSQADGTVDGWLELGAEGIWMPTRKASPRLDGEGNPLPFEGPGPFQGGIALWPTDEKGGAEGPDGPFGLVLSLVTPLIRVRVEVGSGGAANTASGRLVLASTGPVALRPEAQP